MKQLNQGNVTLHVEIVRSATVGHEPLTPYAAVAAQSSQDTPVIYVKNKTGLGFRPRSEKTKRHKRNAICFDTLTRKEYAKLSRERREGVRGRRMRGEGRGGGGGVAVIW